MDDARFVAAWQTGGVELFPAPDPHTAPRRRSFEEIRRVITSFRPAVAVASVFVAAAVALVVFLPGPGGNGLPDDVTGPVLTAIEAASRNGLAVIPGGENSLDPEPSAFRSGTVSDGSRLGNSLDR